MTNFTRVVTHYSTFHADDVVACAVLNHLNPTAEILRTRDESLLVAGDIAVDVFKGPYDHHQKGGNGKRTNGVPYASAGLVWRDFGPAFVRSIAAAHKATLTDKMVTSIVSSVDFTLIQGVDGMDCGLITGSNQVGMTNVNVMSVSSCISAFNPEVTFEVVSEDTELAAFMEALDFAQKLLTKQVLRAMARVVWTDRVIAADKGGAVLVLNHPCPDVACGWTREVVAREHIKFVVFPATVGGEWRIKGAPISTSSFETRGLLPESLRGLHGAELNAAAGTTTAIFVHKDGWIGGAVGEEDIRKLASLAVATL